MGVETSPVSLSTHEWAIHKHPVLFLRYGWAFDVFRKVQLEPTDVSGCLCKHSLCVCLPGPSRTMAGALHIIKNSRRWCLGSTDLEELVGSSGCFVWWRLYQLFVVAYKRLGDRMMRNTVRWLEWSCYSPSSSWKTFHLFSIQKADLCDDES